MAHTFAALTLGKAGRRLKLTDFLLKWGPKRRQTSEELMTIFRALARK